MSIEETDYFNLFLYTSVVYWIATISLIIFYKLVTTKKLPRYGLLLILGTTILDGVIFGVISLHWVTSKRENIRFNEKGFYFSLPQYREDYLPLNSEFRYFNPALWGKYTARDTTNLTYFDKNPSLTASLHTLAEEIMDGKFPFYPHITKVTFSDFIIKESKNYNNWDELHKLAYLSLLEIGVAHIFAKILQDVEVSTFFSILRSSENQFLTLLKKDIKNGYISLRDKTKWQGKDEVVDIFKKMIRGKLPFHPNTKSQIKLKRIILAVSYLYRNLTVVDYIMHLRNNYRLRNVNTFVQFKDYAKLISLFNQRSFNINLPLIRKKIKQDMGITSPLIKFYPSACFKSKLSYFEDLKKDYLDNKILYLHHKKTNSAIFFPNNEHSQRINFSYQILTYNPNYLKLSYEVNTQGFLFFSDSYDKYWQAKVDGKHTLLYQANGCFKAIRIPSGKHKVEFLYRPTFYRLSLVVYYILSSGCLLFLLIGTNNKLLRWFVLPTRRK
ncbi:MAG: hypothetical protein B6D55_01100 [Candidatus Omnitrophica bacterium 4484_70.2]|nr:MAG: hypothetical protein B6D55_01100 [Candidatus Omnitrophica bacterium 4484_70.2]